MRESTIHALVVARLLLDHADILCLSEDRYLASAGLVVLQDSLEAVLYALLLEIGADDHKNLERKGFDELISELKAAGVPVPKSGTLKSLNKQRVLVKHYAQLAEPSSVRTYHSAALEAIATMTQAVLGRTLRDLFIADLLQDCEAKDFLRAAEEATQNVQYLNALIFTRKAVFVEFEADYSVYGWRDHDGSKHENFLAAAMRGGWRALSWTRNSEWIQEHVKIPTDYVQIDYQDLRIQAMEIGIHTTELQNLLRLTPHAFRGERRSPWAITYDASFEASNANEANARYCLDRAVSIILKKQQHASVRREPARDVPFDPPPIYVGRALHERPDTGSPTVHLVQDGFTYTIRRFVGGFNPEESFYDVLAEANTRADNSILEASSEYANGFLLIRE